MGKRKNARLEIYYKTVFYKATMSDFGVQAKRIELDHTILGIATKICNFFKNRSS